ncbi:MAG: helix-turn-helix transcriptional regulator, partial [Lachnospiraceae bacterium]
MTQVEFSKRTGIATTTISDWRKKNTNPGSEKIMQICAALEVTPEYLLSGVCEDSDRGKAVDYMVIPQGTEERELLELFNEMQWLERARLLEYAKKLSEKTSSAYKSKEKKAMKKIAEFCDIEIY